ncbi:hypothetical protein BH10BDE1_BH10BDE1_27220 [soil metagenome]
MSDSLNAYKATAAWAAATHVETIAREVSPSTNAEAKSLLGQLGTRSLIIANHQTSGRGRGDHTWSDSAGQALLSSWIFHVPKSPQPILSALVGLALFEAVSVTWPSIVWALRAPNDLHVVPDPTATGGIGHRDVSKMAGILIELTNSAIGQVSIIVGLGMNVSSAPTGTKPYAATSLHAELASRGVSVTAADWSKFLSAWIANCESRIVEGLNTELQTAARWALAAALRKHPEYRELREVDLDGSLVFNDGRRVAWAAL